MNNLKITWLCQGGFLLDDGKSRIVVDPYLSNSLYSSGLGRLVAIPVSFEDLKPDLVIFTHDHADHYNVETVVEIVKMYPKCKYAGPSSARDHFAKDGYDTNKFTVLDVGSSMKFGEVKIDAVKADHSDVKAIGTLISIADKLVYISGDTLYSPELNKKILSETKGRKIDIAMVCINGKWGNMNDTEAVQFMRELMPARAVPMHYGLFAKNTANPANFVKSVRELGIKCDEMVAGKETTF